MAGSLSSWLLAVRPKTLSAALVPIAVASALAGPRFQLWIAALALFTTILIQVGTNLINDALDFKKGADTEERLGPVRVTQSGLLSERAVFAGGLLCFTLAIGAAVPLMITGGTPILGIAAISVVFGYLYTGGPFPLAYHGLGDLFVLVFFGFVAVLGMSILFGTPLGGSVWVAGAQTGAMSTVMIAINNLRDHRTDRVAGKRTLAVRFGPDFVRAEIVLLLLLPLVLGAYWWKLGRLWAAALPFLALPLALKVIRGVSTTEPSRAYNAFLAQASAYNMAFGFLLSVGLLL